MSKELIEFAKWIPTMYEPCNQHEWKYRYPKTSEEMKKCFTSEEVYDEYKKKVVAV